MKSKRNLVGLLILSLATLGLVFVSKIAVIADPYLDYLKSTSSPEILVEKSLQNGSGGSVSTALERSFYDPNCSPGTDYTTRTSTGAQYAMDINKVYYNGSWYRIMSDCNNEAGGSADGYEDGLGNASSLYDNAMAIIALTHAGETAKAQKIMNGLKDSIFIRIDDATSASKHIGASTYDQGETRQAFPAGLQGYAFDVWKDSNPNDGNFNASVDTRVTGYPRLSPGHEFGMWLNNPDDPSWAGVDDYIDNARVSEYSDDNDTDTITFAPYFEKGYYYRLYNPYRWYNQWYNADKVASVGTSGTSQQYEQDALVSYSSMWQKDEYKQKEYASTMGDNLWLALAVCYYTHQTGDTQYLDSIYPVLDLIADNLQGFNGGIHYGYYGSHEITAVSTEHNLDWMFVWYWINHLYTDGKVDADHWNRYKAVTDGNLTLASTDIKILSVGDSSQDDNAANGADYMLKFLAIPHSIYGISTSSTTIDLSNVKVLILPETPWTSLNAAVRTAIYNFATGGGSVFGTCRTGVSMGSSNNPFGVSMGSTQAVGDATHPIKFSCRNIVVDKVFKDGRDNSSWKIDSNFNGMPDDGDADDAPEADNWEEGAGNMLFAFTAAPPYDDMLIWAHPDYKRSRLTYYLMDIGDSWHALNGGYTPDLWHAADTNTERGTNTGTSITCDTYAKTPTYYTANDYGFITLLRAKVDTTGITYSSGTYTYDPTKTQEFLYFNKPSTSTTNVGKAVYFAGDMFSTFWNIINHTTVNGYPYSPYENGYEQLMIAHAAILQNAFTWFFTPGLDPVYATHDPYGSNTVYSENYTGEAGHFNDPHNKFGSDSTDPGKSITVFDMNYSTAPQAYTKCIKMTKDNTETYGGVWLTKNIDWGPFNGMVSGIGQGMSLNGSTKLTFWAKADTNTPNVNVTYLIGISSGTSSSDSATISFSTTVTAGWSQYSIDVSTLDLSHINGLLGVKITSTAGTIYMDEIHYEPRLFGYNDEGVEGKRTIYREGRNNEGIWSGWFGYLGSTSTLTMDKIYTTDPYYGYYCMKISKTPGYYAGIFVQQLGWSPNEDDHWASGPGIGANLSSSTYLSFWVKSESNINNIEFGYGYTSGAGDSSYVHNYYNLTSTNTWTNIRIDLSGKDLSHINGLFYFTIPNNASTVTFYLDSIKYEVGGNPLSTYDDDVEAKNQSPTIWRDKGLKHLGVDYFLKNCVWGDSDNFTRIPPGMTKTSTDADNDGKVDDWQYEQPWSSSTWTSPANWAREKVFMRGCLDWFKAADLGTWGAVYWLQAGDASSTNAKACVAYSTSVFTCSIDKKSTTYNMALRKTAAASSQPFTGLEASKAFDGDSGTRWASAYNDPEWISADLYRPMKVWKIVLNWENSSTYDDQYLIEYSSNNINWSTAFATNSASGQVHTIDMSTYPITARYWRMYGIHRAGGWAHSLWNFDIYGYDAQTSMGYWDSSNNDIDTVGDDFGTYIWPEGIGQLAHAAEYINDNYVAMNALNTNEQVGYTFASGVKGVPYSWPGNMITAKGANWGEDGERDDSLSICATAWTYIAKNRVDFYGNTTMPAALTNLSLNKTATASSTLAYGVEPGRAIDGDSGTRWTSNQSDPEWIRIDLGSAATVTEIVLKWEGGAASVWDDEYKIQYSNNDSDWTDAFYTDKGTGATQMIPIPNISARYWRMYGMHRANSYSHSLWEFEIYGTPGAQNDPVKVRIGSTYYNTITAAYAAAADGATIQCLATDFYEGLNCDRAITVNLQGGYSADWSSNSGTTNMFGTFNAGLGTINVTSGKFEMK